MDTPQVDTEKPEGNQSQQEQWLSEYPDLPVAWQSAYKLATVVKAEWSLEPEQANRLLIALIQHL
jgi:hypothetical protein